MKLIFRLLPKTVCTHRFFEHLIYKIRTKHCITHTLGSCPIIYYKIPATINNAIAAFIKMLAKALQQRDDSNNNNKKEPTAIPNMVICTCQIYRNRFVLCARIKHCTMYTAYSTHAIHLFASGRLCELRSVQRRHEERMSGQEGERRMHQLFSQPNRTIKYKKI